jgi:hypothetical protein
MKGNFHGPGGKLIVELLQFHLLTILNSTKRKRKRKKVMKVIILKKGL